MKFHLAIAACLTAAVVGASVASAGDDDKKQPAPSAKARVLVIGDGAARFNVERDATAGRVTFRLADPNVKLDSAPVKVVGSREVALTPAAGEPNVWVWTDEAAKKDAFDGSLMVVVAGKAYTSPLTTVWTTDGWAEPAPSRVTVRYGGRLLALPSCGGSVEVVQDVSTGAMTIYSTEEVKILEAPEILVPESEGVATVTFTKMEGKDGVWTATHKTFKSDLVAAAAKIRLSVDGKVCEAPVQFTGSHGGQLVAVAGGPSFEIVRDPKAGHYTFYAVDETLDGKTYVIEKPTVVYEGRSYTLTQVENEPRAWRLVGLDAGGSTPRDAQLNFTLFGKTLSTRVGLSGLGVQVK
jgi:hypothetical protein